MLTQMIWQCLHKVISWVGWWWRENENAPRCPAKENEEDGILTVSCRCGACTMHLSGPLRQQAAATDCHCPSCRQYHTAAFCSFLQVRRTHVRVVKNSNNDNDDAWQSYRHECAQLGVVDRLFCKLCFAKLATVPVVGDDETHNWNDDADSYYYINMGSLQDDTIRADYSAWWSHHRTAWQVDDPSQMAPWYPAHNDYVQPNDEVEMGTPPPTTTSHSLTGGCACGRARYEITHWDIPNHMPHCYCHVCRHSAGAAFLSWIFCAKAHFRWTSTPPPRCVRTTDMAVRYYCDTCAGNVLLVYDEEADDWVWPTVGSIDDDSWRKMTRLIMAQQQEPPPQRRIHTTGSVRGCADGCLDDVSHIYCVDRPLWYALPDDGLPRWDE